MSALTVRPSDVKNCQNKIQGAHITADTIQVAAIAILTWISFRLFRYFIGKFTDKYLNIYVVNCIWHKPAWIIENMGQTYGLVYEDLFSLCSQNPYFSKSDPFLLEKIWYTGQYKWWEDLEQKHLRQHSPQPTIYHTITSPKTSHLSTINHKVF